MQLTDNPINGTRVAMPTEASLLLRPLRGRPPSLFELRRDNGVMLTIGLADDCASVQYCSVAGLPPYLMAVADDGADNSGVVAFLAGGTPTPICRRFCLPIDRVERIASDFLVHGRRSETVSWEEI